MKITDAHLQVMSACQHLCDMNERKAGAFIQPETFECCACSGLPKEKCCYLCQAEYENRRKQAGLC